MGTNRISAQPDASRDEALRLAAGFRAVAIASVVGLLLAIVVLGIEHFWLDSTGTTGFPAEPRATGPSDMRNETVRSNITAAAPAATMDGTPE